jgi:hypothetical protein
MKEKEAAHYLEIWRAKNKTKQKKASTLNPKMEKKMLYFKYTFTTLQVLALPFFTERNCIYKYIYNIFSNQFYFHFVLRTNKKTKYKNDFKKFK